MKKGYDYVVVGGGSAGCVLAARLSEDAFAQVALIEAGAPDDAPEIHTPAAFAQLFKSDHDWDYSSEPELRLAVVARCPNVSGQRTRSVDLQYQ
jgi:choline dehydrogenase